MSADSNAGFSSGSKSDSAELSCTVVNSLGARLKALRLAYGLSQRELAKRSLITNSNISMIEQGTVSPSVLSLTRILNAFPISLADFFAWDVRIENKEYVFSAKTLIAYQKLDEGLLLQRIIGLGGAPLLNPQIDLRHVSLAVNYSSCFAVPERGVDLAGFVIAGKLSLFVGGQSHQLQEGDAFYIPAHHRYRMDNVTTEPVRLILCSLAAPSTPDI